MRQLAWDGISLNDDWLVHPTTGAPHWFAIVIAEAVIMLDIGLPIVVNQGRKLHGPLYEVQSMYILYLYNHIDSSFTLIRMINATSTGSKISGWHQRIYTLHGVTPHRGPEEMSTRTNSYKQPTGVRGLYIQDHARANSSNVLRAQRGRAAAVPGPLHVKVSADR